MTRLTLSRLETGDEGTFGMIELPDGSHMATGELPDRGNARGAGCVPAGVYPCTFEDSPRLGRKTYRLANVPGRDGILIHSANFVGDKEKGKKSQVLGCIALGESLGALEGQKAVLGSRKSVNRFEALMAGAPFELEIVDTWRHG